MYLLLAAHTCRISIAVAIRFLDPTLGLGYTRFRRFYTPSGSLSHSLSVRLIPAGAFRGWCAVRTLQTIRSVDRSLSTRRRFRSDQATEQGVR